MRNASTSPRPPRRPREYGVSSLPTSLAYTSDPRSPYPFSRDYDDRQSPTEAEPCIDPPIQPDNELTKNEPVFCINMLCLEACVYQGTATLLLAIAIYLIVFLYKA